MTSKVESSFELNFKMREEESKQPRSTKNEPIGAFSMENKLGKPSKVFLSQNGSVYLKQSEESTNFRRDQRSQRKNQVSTSQSTGNGLIKGKQASKGLIEAQLGVPAKGSSQPIKSENQILTHVISRLVAKEQVELSQLSAFSEPTFKVLSKSVTQKYGIGDLQPFLKKKGSMGVKAYIHEKRLKNNVEEVLNARLNFFGGEEFKGCRVTLSEFKKHLSGLSEIRTKLKCPLLDCYASKFGLNIIKDTTEGNIDYFTLPLCVQDYFNQPLIEKYVSEVSVISSTSENPKILEFPLSVYEFHRANKELKILVLSIISQKNRELSAISSSSTPKMVRSKNKLPLSTSVVKNKEISQEKAEETEEVTNDTSASGSSEESNLSCPSTPPTTPTLSRAYPSENLIDCSFCLSPIKEKKAQAKILCFQPTHLFEQVAPLTGLPKDEPIPAKGSVKRSKSQLALANTKPACF